MVLQGCRGDHLPRDMARWSRLVFSLAVRAGMLARLGAGAAQQTARFVISISILNRQGPPQPNQPSHSALAPAIAPRRDVKLVVSSIHRQE
jgi:hypothetical protein